MKRLVVLIGVRQPGGDLPALESIAKCLTDMRDWASVNQKISDDDIKIFTDIPELLKRGASPATIGGIVDWIKLREKDWVPADQLIIYFTGHGMSSGGVGLWLLPEAPGKTWEAINLASSKLIAEWTRFGHVVFIGDCCATVASTGQFDKVTGAPAFYNSSDQTQIKKKPVDTLLAAKPGQASFEVQIQGTSLSPYTVQLVQALRGTPANILESELPNKNTPLVLRIRKLAAELQVSVNTFLRGNGIARQLFPVDALEATSEWISSFQDFPPQPQPPPPPPTGPSPRHAPGPGSAGGPQPGDDASQIPLIAPGAASSSQGPLGIGLDQHLIGLAGGVLTKVQGNEWSASIPDGYHYETACGFYINGPSVIRADARDGVSCEVASTYEVKVDPARMELVAIEFEGGGGVMVPAIAGQIGFLHFDEGRLVSLAYEPSGQSQYGQKSGRREVFEEKVSRIRNLRDTLLNVIADGDLGFVSVQLQTVLESLQQTNYKTEVDFSTLLYLGYVAFATPEARAAIPILATYSQSRFGFVPFDFKIFLKLSRTKPDPLFGFAPPFPLLTQGWSLLQASHDGLPEELEELPTHYRNASWTQFDRRGLELCQKYLAAMETSGTQGGNAPPAAFSTAYAAGIADAPVALEDELTFAVEETSALPAEVTFAVEEKPAPAKRKDDEERTMVMEGW